MLVSDIWDKLIFEQHVEIIKTINGTDVTLYDSRLSPDYPPDILMYHVDLIGAYAENVVTLFVH